MVKETDTVALLLLLLSQQFKIPFYRPRHASPPAPVTITEQRTITRGQANNVLKEWTIKYDNKGFSQETSEKIESILTPEFIRVLGPNSKRWVVKFARMTKKPYLEEWVSSSITTFFYYLLLSTTTTTTTFFYYLLLSATIITLVYSLLLPLLSSIIDILFHYRHSLLPLPAPLRLHPLDDTAGDEIIALEEEQLSESKLVEYQTEETISQNYKNVNRQHSRTYWQSCPSRDG